MGKKRKRMVKKSIRKILKVNRTNNLWDTIQGRAVGDTNRARRDKNVI